MLLRFSDTQIDRDDAVRAFRMAMARRPAPSLTLRGTLGIILVLVLFGCIMAAINTSSPPRPADEAPSSDILWRRNAGLGVFAGGFASLCLAGFASGRLRRREAPAMPALQLVVTAAEDGLTFDDGNGRNRFRWSYFLGFMESEKSFVLQGDKISATQCLLKIVPKSAFATEDELLEFRALLAQKILPEARRV